MTRVISLSEALKTFRGSLPDEARIYVAGGSAEPLSLANTLRRSPDLAAGLTFLGAWIPGVNATDWASLHPEARAETTFVSPALRPSFDAGQTKFVPNSYSQSVRWLSTTPLQAGVIMVSPPDEDGLVSLGVSVDFSPLILAREEVPLLGIINPALEAPAHGPKIPISRFQYLVESEHQLVQIGETELPEDLLRIGRHIAGLCEPGDTLQFGLGNVQQAALKALTSHQELRIHAGMVSDPLIDLLDNGSIIPDYGAITTGVAIGTDQLYDRVVRDDRIVFAPVSYTHATSTLASIDKFKAINSCLEIDLFGQANAVSIGGRQVSGIGGLSDFLRGAAESNGGRGILALRSTARGGKISRIVPRLSDGATSIARTNVDTVVTEHGVAHLRHKPLEARAAALIAVADPAFQNQLADSWHDMRSTM